MTRAIRSHRLHFAIYMAYTDTHVLAFGSEKPNWRWIYRNPQHDIKVNHHYFFLGVYCSWRGHTYGIFMAKLGFPAFDCCLQYQSPYIAWYTRPMLVSPSPTQQSNQNNVLTSLDDYNPFSPQYALRILCYRHIYLAELWKFTTLEFV